MIERLKKRRDFLAAAKGRRAPRHAFVLEMQQRSPEGPSRIGFTVTKRTAPKAVERNRIRRRLREAARLAAGDAFLAGCDYVIIGRRNALAQPFGRMQADLVGAARQVASPARGGSLPARSSRS